MSSSRSNSSNLTTTVDERTTQTINAGIGGNIGEGAGVISGNYGDTTMVGITTDHGAIDDAMWIASDSVDSMRRLSDSALHEMGSTVEGALDFGGDAIAESLDFGRASLDFGRASAGQAFDFGGDAMAFVGDSVSGVFNFFEGLSMELVDLVGSSLESSEDLAARSLDGAMSIKAGQTITEPANQTIREVAKYGVWAAGLAAAAYVAARAMN